MSPDDPGIVLELIGAFRRSKTMFTAVRLGVFDRLHERPCAVNELARELGAGPGALARLLDGCVGLGLLVKRGEEYHNTEAANVYLRQGSSRSLAGYILYSDAVLYPLWAHLDDAVREGTHRWRQTFGWEGGIFEHLFHTPESRRTFLEGMHGLGLLSSREVVRVFNLSRFPHMVDLGGATGHLAIAACERYGSMRATVYDLAEVVQHAGPHLEASAARERLETQAGDFFRDELPRAGLYALGRIVHDWSEEKMLALLRRIHAVLPAGGGVLLAEALLDEDGTGPVSAQMQSLNMLIATEGRERTPEEYRALLEGAGFGDVETRRTGAPLDAVLAIKKQ
ncbi:MAG: homocysteine methyltransferase [Candidatus Solibacter usitatus]|nr:homocysteine methyltransferase [Candidatus Solibacter usitatus]